MRREELLKVGAQDAEVRWVVDTSAVDSILQQAVDKRPLKLFTTSEIPRHKRTNKTRVDTEGEGKEHRHHRNTDAVIPRLFMRGVN